MEEEECYFKWKFGCDHGAKDLSSAGSARIKTIIKCSKQYGDGLHVVLQEKLDANSDLTIQCHRECVSTYVSQQQVNRHLKRQGIPPQMSATILKKQRRSGASNFEFLHHCIFCGFPCNIEKDPKHPDRWRRAVLCRTADRGSGAKSFKDLILETCDTRNDGWASEVRVRVMGALSDLHAADARYHVDCMSKFLGERSVKYAFASVSHAGQDDDAFNALVTELSQDLSKIWNSVELFQLYEDNGGTRLTARKQLVKQLSHHFGEDLLVLSSPGVANLVVFRSKTLGLLKMVPPDDYCELDSAINSVGKKIIQELQDVEHSKWHYDIRIDKDSAADCVSDTLFHLLVLAKISPKLDKTLPAILIGNIVTSLLRNMPTTLQIALGMIMKDSKDIVKQRIILESRAHMMRFFASINRPQ